LVSSPAGGRVPIGILALQGAVRAHARILAGLGADVREVRRADDLTGLSGIVLPGGESTTMSRLLERNELFDPLHAALDDGMAALGTCAGMILLAAEVLDGRPDQRSFAAIDLSVRRNAFGRQLDSFEADLDVAGLSDGTDRPVHAVFIRAPFVERVGDGVEVLARVDGHPVCARQGSILVTAFHPELSGDPRIHEAFLTSVAAAAG
jgi:5'-phosphate synthase pdxT subunit